MPGSAMQRAHRRYRRVGEPTMYNKSSSKKPHDIRVRHRLGAGIDVHNEYLTACVAVQQDLDIERVAVQEFKRTPRGLGEMCRFLGKHLIESIVMEATGVYTPVVLDALEAYKGWGGIKPRIAVINPTIIRKFPGEVHEDNRDALGLASLGLAGLATGSYIPQGFQRVLRTLTREMRFIDRDCTRTKNRIKRILSLHGLPLKDFDLGSKWATYVFQAILQAHGHFGKAMDLINDGTMKVPATSKTAITRRAKDFQQYVTISIPAPVLVVLESYYLQLAFNAAIMERIRPKIEALVVSDPVVLRQVRHLATIPGISEAAATSLVAEVGNVARFRNRRAFLNYVGCASAQYISGKTDLAGHLSPRANKFARYVFIMAGKAIVDNIQEDSELKEYARKQLNDNWKDKKLAYTNTGIKVARVTYAMLRNGQSFEQFRETRPTAPVAASGQQELAPEKPDKLVLRTIRQKTRNLVKFMNRHLADAKGPHYARLGELFRKLQHNEADEDEDPDEREKTK